MAGRPAKPAKQNSPAGAGLRARAAQALYRVCDQGQLLDSVLDAAKTEIDEDHAWFQQLLYGTLRHYETLEAIADELLQKPFRKKDRDIHALLLLGLYQLLQMHVAEHAALNTTVAAADILGKSWGKNVLNACLRRFTRERQELLQRVNEKPVARFNHPHWLLQRLQHDWPDQWQDIVTQNNRQAPMTLRVNTMQGTRDAYLAELQSQGITAVACDESDAALQLQQAVAVELLPGFHDGRCSVQDLAAQLVVPMLQIEDGHRLLDACAAPGGKTAAILEQCHGQCEVTAVELHDRRFQRLQQTLQRLHLSANTVAGDAGEPGGWWDGEPYDRILLDAPCSATGVIRRHPDIKRHRHDDDIDLLAQQQGQLLDALWPLLRPQGLLLYVTCSVLVAENDDVIEGFVARQEDVKVLSLTLPWATKRRAGVQVLPGSHDADGFYYALLQKHPAS